MIARLLRGLGVCSSYGDNSGAPPAFHRGGDGRANGVDSAPERVGVKMRIAVGRGRLRAPKQLTDDRQAERSARAEAGEGVAEIMQPDAFKPSSAANRGPRLLEVHPRRAILRPSDDMWVALDARDSRQSGLRRRGKADRLLAGAAPSRANSSLLRNRSRPCSG
jgi:hypothetical protein